MRRAVSIVLILCMALSLCACGHEHSWTEASCTQPKTCSECGATEGEALGHEWKEATCTEPKTCTRCGETEGAPLGHEWSEATCTEPKTCTRCGEKDGKPLGHLIDNWTTEKEATCSEPGKEKGVCSRCGETVEQEIKTLEHTPSDWIVTVPATIDQDGKRIKKCTVCGKELESESFSLTPQEYEKEYKKQCATIAYNELQRNPGTYKGSYIKVSGSVFQIISEASSSMYYSVYFIKAGSNIYLIKVDNYDSGRRILENDRITVWGEVGDLYTYQTVRGDSKTVPTIYVEFFS